MTAQLAFSGIDVLQPADLHEDTRKIIEFIGDSITEGVMIDMDYSREPAFMVRQHNRVYENDACATYGWLTAERLNIRPVLMGYGAVGITKGGNGGVVRALEAYPFNFHDSPYKGASPDIIVMNYGANDRFSNENDYISGYVELLDIIRSKQPHAILCVLSAFCNVHTKALACMVGQYNEMYKSSVRFFNASGWIPPEPLHPNREGHRVIAENLSRLLKTIIE